MKTSGGLGCSATNFSQTTLLLMVLHLDAWQLHVFLYFLGPMYFRLFFRVLIFLGGLSKRGGGLLATQSIPPPRSVPVLLFPKNMLYCLQLLE